MQKDKRIVFGKWKTRYCLLLLMAISVGLMLWMQNNIFVILAAIFTFLYFVLWVKENVLAFQDWVRKAKGDFAIFGEYADRFTEMFTKNREGKR
ncbi:MAG: hypothetical protein IJM95_04935 [Anaerotignum sp.]|nr:hypothetical protein [Anaerotignum sp.]